MELPENLDKEKDLNQQEEVLPSSSLQKAGRFLLQPAQLLLLAFWLLGSSQFIDEQAGDYHQQALNRALISFAVARTLNGVISVAQGTELALQPAGVGIKLAPGEILDPVNDLIERFSWIMLASATALGMEKLLMEISSSSMIRNIYLIGIPMGLLLLFYTRNRGALWQSVLSTTIAGLVFIRLSMPMMVIVNEQVHIWFFADTYQQANNAVKEQANWLEEENQLDEKQKPSLLESIKNMGNSTSPGLNKKISTYTEKVTASIEHLLKLAAIFLLETLVLPLLFLYLGYRFTHFHFQKLARHWEN